MKKTLRISTQRPFDEELDRNLPSETDLLLDACQAYSKIIHQDSWDNRPQYDEDAGVFVSHEKYDSRTMAERFALCGLVETITVEITKHANLDKEIVLEIEPIFAGALAQLLIWSANIVEKRAEWKAQESFETDRSSIGDEAAKEEAEIVRKDFIIEQKKSRKTWRKLGDRLVNL